MQAKVEICGVNTSELPVYSGAQTDALLRRAAAGDRGARDELIRGNLRLVLSVVQRFRDRGESPDDLFQVGCIGHRARRAVFHLCRADERALWKSSDTS